MCFKTNAKNSINIDMIEFFAVNGYDNYKINQSPYSLSTYITFYNDVDDISIRISNHPLSTTQYISSSHIYSIFSTNGSFIFNKLIVYEIDKLLKNRKLFFNENLWYPSEFIQGFILKSETNYIKKSYQLNLFC